MRVYVRVTEDRKRGRERERHIHTRSHSERSATAAATAAVATFFLSSTMSGELHATKCRACMFPLNAATNCVPIFKEYKSSTMLSQMIAETIHNSVGVNYTISFKFHHIRTHRPIRWGLCGECFFVYNKKCTNFDACLFFFLFLPQFFLVLRILLWLMPCN